MSKVFFHPVRTHPGNIFYKLAFCVFVCVYQSALFMRSYRGKVLKFANKDVIDCVRVCWTWSLPSEDSLHLPAFMLRCVTGGLETAVWLVITTGCGLSVFCFSMRGLHGVAARLAPVLPWKRSELVGV